MLLHARVPEAHQLLQLGLVGMKLFMILSSQKSVLSGHFVEKYIRLMLCGCSALAYGTYNIILFPGI